MVFSVLLADCFFDYSLRDMLFFIEPILYYAIAYLLADYKFILETITKAQKYYALSFSKKIRFELT